MPNLYARASALPDVVGRVKYISNPDKQEFLLAAYDGAADLLGGQFWQQLAKESQAAFEQFGYEERAGREKKLKCCEGRELVIQLSNALLERMTPEEIAKTIADEFRSSLGLTVAVGLHRKSKGEKHDNLHAHVVFPERTLLDEPVIKVAERSLFFGADGKRRYKKSDILDANKQLLPGCRIVQKGEVYEQRYFGSVDQKYSSKSWLKDTKTNVILRLRNGALKGDVEITEYDRRTGKLPLQHIGKETQARDAVQILRANEMVRKFNAMVDNGQISHTLALKYQTQILGAASRNAALFHALRELENTRRRNEREALRESGEKHIQAYHDYELQRQIDAVRICREVGVSNATELEKKKAELGREYGIAKKKYEVAQEQGDLMAQMQAAEEFNAVSKRLSEVHRAIETLNRGNGRSGSMER